MKKVTKRKIWCGRFCIGVTFSLAIMFQACTSQAAKEKKDRKQMTVLGMGDSITEGGPEHYSYLFPLDSMLRQSGYEPRFIGPRFAIENGDTLHHAGYSGKTAEFLAAHVDSIYALYPADIVLLHAGHNHFQEEAPIPGIVNALLNIIRSVKAKNPKALIFVAGVVTSGKLPKYKYIPALDTAIQMMVQSLNDPTVVFVDQRNHWNWQDHTIYDKVHPNETGAHVIASNWFSAIIRQLKKNNEHVQL